MSDREDNNYSIPYTRSTDRGLRDKILQDIENTQEPKERALLSIQLQLANLLVDNVQAMTAVSRETSILMVKVQNGKDKINRIINIGSTLMAVGAIILALAGIVYNDRMEDIKTIVEENEVIKKEYRNVHDDMVAIKAQIDYIRNYTIHDKQPRKEETR